MTQEAIDLYNEGYRYYSGMDGYPLNYGKALEYFQKSADLGLSEAMNYLGVIYERGEIVPQDYNMAASWYYRAVQADSENPHALYNMGRMCYNGTGIEKNLIKAYQFYKAAVDLGRGNTHSSYPSSCYMTGCVLTEYYKNYKEAYPYFKEAAEYGDIPEAWFNLGWLAEKGYVPVKNPGSNAKVARDNLALGYYKKAAESGDPEALDSVGRLYAAHNMFDEARPWIEKAAAKGYEPAKKRLRQLNVARSGSIWDYFK